MDHRDEVREFLTSRRAKISPERAGLPAGPGRRVPGLRRAEAAVLANVSVEYYARLERGNLAGVSEPVLDAIARALQLDEAERAYLFNLARTANRTPAARPYPDWDLAANITVAILRTEAGRDPHDKGLQDLIGELSTRSQEFRTRWAAHNVRIHGSGTKQFHHSIVGELKLNYEEMELNAEPGLSLVIFTAEPASPSEERLRLLASWTATVDASSSIGGTDANWPPSKAV